MHKQTSKIDSANKIKGNQNKVTIHNYPPPPVPPPFEHVQVFDILQSKDAELRKLENLIELLQDRVHMQAAELERLREHISQKDYYINNLIFKQTG